MTLTTIAPTTSRETATFILNDIVSQVKGLCEETSGGSSRTGTTTAAAAGGDSSSTSSGKSSGLKTGQELHQRVVARAPPA